MVSNLKKILFIIMVWTLLCIPASGTVTFTNGIVDFDSEADLPALLTAVNNVSQLSETGGIYTMHVPFHQNSSSNLFTINTTLHLNSTTGTIVHLTFEKVLLDGATILGWNTTSDSLAPKTDTTRAYITINGGTTIENSNLSYLGYSDSYPGVNIYTALTINDSTFIGNYYGICGDADGLTISNSVIRDTANIGIYVFDTTTISYNTVYNTSNGGIVGTFADLTTNDNVVYNSTGYGIAQSFGTLTSLNDSAYSNDLSGINAVDGTNTVTNATVYSNGQHGIYTDTATSCNVSDYGNDYYDYRILSTKTIIDNQNSSNVFGIYSSGTAIIQNTTDAYDVSYTATSTTTGVIQNPKETGERLNCTILNGELDQVVIYNLDSSTKYIIFHSNGTVLQQIISTAGGVGTITENMGIDTYYVTQGYDNFTFSNASVTPSNITTAETSVASITVTDYDGTLSTVYANIDGVNYTAINVAGNVWNYTYTLPSTGVKVVLFYAQDNHGYWNSTDPSLSITVTSPSTPTPTPTATPSPIVHVPDDVEEKKVVPSLPPKPTPPPPPETSTFLGYSFAWYALIGAYLGAMLVLNFFGKAPLGVITEGILYGTISWIIVLIFDKIIPIVSSSNATMFIVFLIASMAITTIAELLLGEDDNIKSFRNLKLR